MILCIFNYSLYIFCFIKTINNKWKYCNDNDSFGTGQANIVRGMLFMGSGSRMQIMNHDADYSHLVNETKINRQKLMEASGSL